MFYRFLPKFFLTNLYGPSWPPTNKNLATALVKTNKKIGEIANMSRSCEATIRPVMFPSDKAQYFLSTLYVYSL